MLKIAIVGPESSGKTTLSEGLAQHYGAFLVPEEARSFLPSLGRAYVEVDLLHIAMKQLEAERFARGRSPELIICDTDMITIRIWSQEKFGRVDPTLEELVCTTHYDHWLLCKPDMPWEPDPLREDPHDRDRLFGIYERTLFDLARPFVIVEGPHEVRMRTAVTLLDRWLDDLRSEDPSATSRN